jgi:hypothetical protein
VLALRTDDVDDLIFQQLGQHREADADAQRQEPLLRRADWPSASCTRGGNTSSPPRSAAATCSHDTVFMAVPPPVD